MTKKFISWLNGELTQRKWSHRELARRCQVSQSLVSRTLSGELTPSADFSIKVAKVLNEQPEQVLRIANILPSLPPNTADPPTVSTITELVRNMPEAKRQLVLNIVQAIDQDHQKTETG